MALGIPGAEGRWQPTRAGAVNSRARADETLRFADGWLALAGPNGSGKSLTASMLVTVLLDAETTQTALSVSGKASGTLTSRHTDRNDREDRSGAWWLEYGLRNASTGRTKYLTTGLWLRSTGSELQRAFFIVPGRTGDDLLPRRDRDAVRITDLTDQLAALGGELFTSSSALRPHATARPAERRRRARVPLWKGRIISAISPARCGGARWNSAPSPRSIGSLPPWTIWRASKHTPSPRCWTSPGCPAHLSHGPMRGPTRSARCKRHSVGTATPSSRNRAAADSVRGAEDAETKVRDTAEGAAQVRRRAESALHDALGGWSESLRRLPPPPPDLGDPGSRAADERSSPDALKAWPASAAAEARATHGAASARAGEAVQHFQQISDEIEVESQGTEQQRAQASEDHAKRLAHRSPPLARVPGPPQARDRGPARTRRTCLSGRTRDARSRCGASGRPRRPRGCSPRAS